VKSGPVPPRPDSDHTAPYADPPQLARSTVVPTPLNRALLAVLPPALGTTASAGVVCGADHRVIADNVCAPSDLAVEPLWRCSTKSGARRFGKGGEREDVGLAWSRCSATAGNLSLNVSRTRRTGRAPSRRPGRLCSHVSFPGAMLGDFDQTRLVQPCPGGLPSIGPLRWPPGISVA
jgi:hypothetical protein